MKPFNPILGETFQASVNGTNFYIEQTSHHPPIFHFLFIGQDFKVYGYNESEVNTGANSLTAKYKGSYTVHFANGIKHLVYFPEFKLSGTLLGNRSIKYKGKMIVVDEKNNLIAQIDMSLDKRGFFKKLVTKKDTYPDNFT